MTLTGVPRYDPDGCSTVGSHAVVLGAGIAGLLAGRVLSDAFGSVTVVDRDPLPDEPVARRSTPQAHHVDAMLEGGRATLSDLFPGFDEAVHREGGVSIDAGSEFKYYHEGDFLASTPTRLPMLCASRPLFERVIRRELENIPRVTLRSEHQFLRYLFDGDSSAVSGVVVRDDRGAEREIDADLVVDATGRTSRTPNWLESRGYASPPVTEVEVDLAYSTVRLDRPPGDRRGFLVAPSQGNPRGGTAVPIENGQWILTVFGLHGDHPPTTTGGVVAFAGSLPTDELRGLLESNAIASDTVHHYPLPASRWRRYDELDRFPDRLVPIGDAIASFNPIYGQGMSVAALEALQLHHSLAADGLRSLSRRYLRRTADVIGVIWRTSVASDFSFEETAGKKPPGTDLFNWYVSRVTRAAHSDGRVSEAFARVLRLERHPVSLLAPRLLARVLLPDRFR